MRRDNWTVGQEGIRQGGEPDRCFYCNQPIGSQHRADCVIRSRTVIIEARIKMLISVPESWDSDMVEFHRNEGSWCASNVVEELDDQAKRCGCLCNDAEFSFVREATDEDEAEYRYSVRSIKG